MAARRAPQSAKKQPALLALARGSSAGGAKSSAELIASAPKKWCGVHFWYESKTTPRDAADFERGIAAGRRFFTKSGSEIRDARQFMGALKRDEEVWSWP